MKDVMMTIVRHLLINDGVIVESMNMDNSGNIIVNVRGSNNDIKISSPIIAKVDGDIVKLSYESNYHGLLDSHIIETARIGDQGGYTIHKIEASKNGTNVRQTDYNSNDEETCYFNYKRDGYYTGDMIQSNTNNLYGIYGVKEPVYVASFEGVEKAPNSEAESSKVTVSAYYNNEWKARSTYYIEPNHSLGLAVDQAKKDPEFLKDLLGSLEDSKGMKLK